MSAPGASRLISSPGTISGGGSVRASSIASASPLVESWSVTARTRTPCFAASRTSWRGVSTPSDAVVCEWRSTAPATLLREVRQERPDGVARRTLRRQRQVLLGEGRPGDVQVRPRRLARELLQEEPRGDRAAAARPDVVEVGHLALEVLAVLVDQRELPEPLTGGVGGLHDPVRQRLVVRQQARAELTEGDDAGAGQRRHVDDLVGLHVGVR